MKPYLLILLFLLSTKVFAQENAIITGKTIDSKTSLPIEYVGVILSSKIDSNKKVGVVTNKAGEFFLKDIAKGDYTLKISQWAII